MARRLCLITGASAGIGAAFARIYASQGYDVALTARRADRLTTLAEEIRLRSGVETIPIVADLGDPGAVEQILSEVAAHGRTVDALVNNAGYGLTGDFAKTGWAEQEIFLRVMLGSVCELTHRVLPGMVEQKFGRIVNVASMAGLLPGTPSATLYGPVKSFLIRFSQSLHLENVATGVHVSALCPGMTYSEFHDVTGSRDRVTRNIPPWLWLGADEVAAAGFEAAEANRPMCVPGPQYMAIALISKVVPDEWIMALMRSRLARMRGV